MSSSLRPIFLTDTTNVTEAEIAAIDWSSTSIGAIAEWPALLRSTLALMLACPTPMFLAWGPDLLCFYNDAYRPFLGYRLDTALGQPFREVWASIWNALEPLVDATLAGEAQTRIDMALDLGRYGVPEAGWWTFTYSPVFDDEGGIAGLLCVTRETTTNVIAARQRDEAEEQLRHNLEWHHVRVEIGDALRSLNSADEIMAFVADRVGPYLGVDRAGYYRVDDDHFIITEEWHTPGGIDMRGRHPMAAFGQGAIDTLRNGGRLRIDDTQTAEGAEAYAANGMAAVLSVAVHHNGRWASGLHVMQDQPRVWNDAEENLLREVGIEAWAAIERIRAADELRALNSALEQQVIERTRRSMLADLSDRLRHLESPGDMAAAAAEVVQHALGNVVAGLGRIDASGERLLIEHDRVSPGLVSIAGDHSMRDYGIYIDDLTRGEIVVIPDVRLDPRTADNVQALDARQVGNLINVPIVERNRLKAIFCITAPGAREWHDDELAFVRDVAERTRLVIEHRRGEHQLRRFAATLQDQVAERTEERNRIWQVNRDMLGVADENGVWLSVNPAWTRVLGWPATVIEGRTSEWLEHPNDRRKTRAEVASLANEVPILDFENRLRTTNGDYRLLSWTAEPVDGRFFCVARDITEQRLQEAAMQKTEEQLRQAQKMEAVGQLTGGVAHDFNNLLTVIRGSVDLLRRRGLPDERRARYIDAIADTADRATRLTSQLLAFARRQTLKPETFDACQSIGAVEEMLATLIGSRIRIRVDVASEHCLVSADRSQFDTAIINMAVNARDAMDGEGDLTITVDTADRLPAMRSHPEIPGSFVTIAVTDTGSGIAPDQLDRIFEPFYTTKGVGHGTGLGLSQVFGFTKQSGGDIAVSSEVGRGSTFRMYLPMAEPEVAAELESGPDAPTPIDHGGWVLVVEDNPEVGAFARSALDELGYNTVLAVDGPSALLEIGDDASRFNVVFSDVVMPGMSGIELAEEIARRHPDLPVILASGYSSVLAEGGVDGFELLQKPYSIEALSRAIQKVTASKGG